MDPLTLAAQRFIRAHETAWDPPPGNGPQPRLLRLEGTPDDRTDILKALRLLEWQPQNRRPLIVVEAAFADEVTFAATVVSQIASDVAAVDQGLHEDGVTRDAPPSKPTSVDAGAMVAFAQRAAEHVAGVLDGLILVLAPKAVHDVAGFEAFVRRLMGVRSTSPALRVDVLAPTVSRLTQVLPAEARFELDRDALFDHLKNIGAKPSSGPAVDAPKLTPERRAQIEKDLGQPIVSLDTGRMLKVLMMDGTRALSEGRAKDAVRKLRAARTLCESADLVREALLVTIGLGTAYITAKNLKAAEACYEQARKRAADIELRPLEVQALFGLGQLRMMQRRFAEARPAFERIAELEDEASPLRTEALRLVEACKRENPTHGLGVVVIR